MGAVDDLLRRLGEPTPLDRVLDWSTNYIRTARNHRTANMNMVVAMRDAVRMLEDLGVQYLLVGSNALSLYDYFRVTEDVDFAVSEADRARIMAEAFRYGFRHVQVRDADGTLRPSRITIRHVGEGVRVELVTHRPELLDLAFRGGERVETSVSGVPVVAPSLGLTILSKLVAGRTKDLADVEELIQVNRDLTDDGPRQRHVLGVLRAHPRGAELVKRFLAIADTVRNRTLADPDRYGEEE